jgi:DNA polymerase-3 subunit epsilon
LREIVLDTETTGLDPNTGDRIVEVGCVELVNHVTTGRTFQRYVNPERDIPSQALAVHGLTEEVLSRHPVFAEIVDDFLDFLGESPLVIHNAGFDLGFINAELSRLERPLLSLDRTIDTVELARRKFPGGQANLDALCRRFRIDNSDRGVHGALKDSLLLTEVYLELIGGRQPGLELASNAVRSAAGGQRDFHPPRPHAPSPEEEAAHERFLDGVPDSIWRR